MQHTPITNPQQPARSGPRAPMAPAAAKGHGVTVTVITTEPTAASSSSARAVTAVVDTSQALASANTAPRAQQPARTGNSRAVSVQVRTTDRR